MTEKILFVDDDTNVLQAIQRQLRKKFDVDVSTDPGQALQSLSTNGPYAVVVSDMQMPGTNGVEFLGKVREKAPNSVRMMLTGIADQQTAMDAVNHGAIFRFLAKPCSTEALCDVLTAGVGQYRLVIAEKDILEKTLSGSIRLLTEILGLVSPRVFSHSSRVRFLARGLAEQLGLNRIWELEVAAMMSQIGCITLAPETIEAVNAGRALPRDEAERYASHPAIASKLLANIPRFESVAKIVELQNDPFVPGACADLPEDRDTITAAAQILKVAIHFDRLAGIGMSAKSAVAKLLLQPAEFDPVIVNALSLIQPAETRLESLEVKICDLNAGAILDEDLRTTNGSLLLTKGQELTYAMLLRLRHSRAKREIPDQLRIRPPAETPPEETRERSHSIS